MSKTTVIAILDMFVCVNFVFHSIPEHLTMNWRKASRADKSRSTEGAFWQINVDVNSEANVRSARALLAHSMQANKGSCWSRLRSRSSHTAAARLSGSILYLRVEGTAHLGLTV